MFISIKSDGNNEGIGQCCPFTRGTGQIIIKIKSKEGSARQSMSLHFRKGDIVAIALIVLLAVLVFVLFLPGQKLSVAYAEVYQNGKLLQTVSLDMEQELAVTGKYTNIITVCDGKIAVTQSDCPGEDCVSCGWLDSAGRSIVCLPNGLEIRVVAENADVDFVVG